MKCSVTLDKLDEEGFTSLYVFTFVGETDSEYSKFWDKFESDKTVQWEFDVIDRRITTILQYGAEDEHFRMEGKGTKALPINANSKLRLYCYRIDPGILIIGNGGIKLKNPDATKNKTKDFLELYRYCETIRVVGLKIEELLRDKTIGRKDNDLLRLKQFEINIPDDPQS